MCVSPFLTNIFKRMYTQMKITHIRSLVLLLIGRVRDLMTNSILYFDRTLKNAGLFQPKNKNIMQ